MARKLRVEYPGAIYDVMNRGDQQELIFRDDFDRRREAEQECRGIRRGWGAARRFGKNCWPRRGQRLEQAALQN